jgi:hypothetical protein
MALVSPVADILCICSNDFDGPSGRYAILVKVVLAGLGELNIANFRNSKSDVVIFL